MEIFSRRYFLHILTTALKERENPTKKSSRKIWSQTAHTPKIMQVFQSKFHTAGQIFGHISTQFFLHCTHTTHNSKKCIIYETNYPENIFPSKKDIGTTRLDSVTFILGCQSFTLITLYYLNQIKSAKEKQSRDIESSFAFYILHFILILFLRISSFIFYLFRIKITWILILHS